MRKQLQLGNSHAECAKYNLWCPTYVLPKEYGLFLEEFKRTPGAVWIMKPIGSAQGKGIFLFNKLHQIDAWKKDHNWKAEDAQPETYITQRYIENPYLIGGKKFDLRLYVLVTSFSPLTVWMYRTGFARLSLYRYSHTRSDIHDRNMHLTNASLQKKADEYDDDQGCKWDLKQVKMHMISKHGMRAVDECFYEIQVRDAPTALLQHYTTHHLTAYPPFAVVRLIFAVLRRPSPDLRRRSPSSASSRARCSLCSRSSCRTSTRSSCTGSTSCSTPTSSPG